MSCAKAWVKPSSDALAAHVVRHLSGWEPTEPPTPLSGGLLNFVWRLPGRPRPVVVKLAPPFVAASPDIPLDPARLRFEAAALRLLGPEGPLRHVPDAAVRPPRLIDFDPTSGLLVLEDLGPLPHLADRLPGGERLGEWLGGFVGRLHAATCGGEALASEMRNDAVQAARHRIQYTRVGDFCRGAGVPDAVALGDAAVDLGLRLMQPGRCLIMGDLWPPSVLVADDGLRVIDWELSHYGTPAQDLGHFAAHLWLLANGPLPAPRAMRVLLTFLEAWRRAVRPAADALLAPDVLRDSALHFGAEILIRTVGTFRGSDPCGTLPPEHPSLRKAVEVAAWHLRDPEASPLFGAEAPGAR